MLNSDFLWLVVERGGAARSGTGTWEKAKRSGWLPSAVASHLQELLKLLWELSFPPTPHPPSPRPPKPPPHTPQTPLPPLLLQFWLLPNLSGRLNMRLFPAATCAGIDTEVLLPRRGQGSSIKQTACLDPLHQRFHTAGTGNTPVSCLNNQGALEAYECET